MSDSISALVLKHIQSHTPTGGYQQLFSIWWFYFLKQLNGWSELIFVIIVRQNKFYKVSKQLIISKTNNTIELSDILRGEWRFMSEHKCQKGNMCLNMVLFSKSISRDNKLIWKNSETSNFLWYFSIFITLYQHLNDCQKAVFAIQTMRECVAGAWEWNNNKKNKRLGGKNYFALTFRTFHWNRKDKCHSFLPVSSFPSIVFSTSKFVWFVCLEHKCWGKVQSNNFFFCRNFTIH